MTEAHPSPLQLDELHAGKDDATVAAHVASCRACADYVAALAREREALQAEWPSQVFMRRLAARAAAKPRWPRWSRWLVAIPVMAAAAVALLVGLQPASFDTVRLKGGGSVALALIALRDGVQERNAPAFTMRPGDQLRIELTLTERRVISVGVLEDTGGFLPLVEAATLDAGLHVLEPALRVDSHPTASTVIAGSPDAVQRAITTRDLLAVVTLRLNAQP